MKDGQIAYEAYKTALNSRTRSWHDLKNTLEHSKKEAADFDRWLRENRHDELTRFFMCDNYETIPEHTKAGWDAFAGAAKNANDPAAAWNSYASKADLNFHKDRRIPFFEVLAPDQKEAIQRAVTCIQQLYHSPSMHM